METREAAWLNTTADDGLPVLPASAGGPWQVLQAFWTRTPATQKTQLYVMSLELDDLRSGGQRIMPHYQIALELHWPIRQTTPGIAEGEQQKFKNAIDLLVQRIRGPMFDKTHGGAFLSAGEVPRSPGVHVSVEPPWVTIPGDKELRGLVTYYCDDYEVQDLAASRAEDLHAELADVPGIPRLAALLARPVDRRQPRLVRRPLRRHLRWRKPLLRPRLVRRQQQRGEVVDLVLADALVAEQHPDADLHRVAARQPELRHLAHPPTVARHREVSACRDSRTRPAAC